VCADDWIGAVIDAFVIDYVFDRPSMIADDHGGTRATDV